ncbi:MAG: hypothetical protein ABR583_14795 [Gaiellaceae bacterium]
MRRTDLPVAWQVETARRNEASIADDLLARVRERVQPETVALDRGYDVSPVYANRPAGGITPTLSWERSATAAR